MRKLLFTLLFIATTIVSAFSQATKISGKVINGKDSSPIEAANVVIEKDGHFISGIITESTGEFSLKTTEAGELMITVSFIGFEKEMKKIIIGKERVFEMGDIALNPSSTDLGEVTVSAQKVKQVVNLETKTYSIGDNISSTGGTIIDMMQSVPGVTVDMNGTVKLRGSEKIGFLINGKPSALLGAGRTGVLKQIPAGSIEKIEIITNPSAKYDPEGMAGIINVVFKEDKRTGLNGEIGFTYGNPNYAYLPTIGLNYRMNNFNIFGSFEGVFKEFLHNNKTTDREKTDGTTQRQIYKTDEKVDAKIYRIGADYTFGAKKNNQISAYWQYENEYETNHGDIKYWDFKQGGVYDSSRIRSVDEYEYNYITDVALTYKHEFAPGTELNGGLIYSYADEEEDYYFKEFKTDNAMNKTTNDPLKAEKTMLSNLNTTIDIYVDFEKKLGDKGKLEAGYRSVVRNIDLNHLWYNTALTPEQLIAGSNYHYIYDEQIHSAYVVYGNEKGKWNYETGLRFEQTNTKSHEDSAVYKFDKNYPLLFPSLKLGYTLKETHELLLSYSGRVNRPDFEQLTYIPKFIDPLNLYKGNPELDPEYVHNMEIGYKKAWGKGFLQLAGFYKNINNPIYEIITFDNKGVATFQPQNFDKSTNLGGEAIFGIDPTKNWSINGSMNYFKNTIAASALNNTEANNDYSWTAKISSLATLPAGIKAQIDGWYNAPINTPQGKIMKQMSLDFSATKSILKGKGEISIKVTDLLKTLKHEESFLSGEYNVSFVDAPDTRFIYIGLKYKF